MTIKDLKENTLKNEAFREVLNNIKHKPFVNEDAIISEEAEKLFENYKFLYSRFHKKNFQQKCYFLKQCIIPYKSFDEVALLLRSLLKNQDFSDKDIMRYYSSMPEAKGTKYETFKEALKFIRVS